MSSSLVSDLSAAFTFRRRPEAIPGDLRPVWRIGLLLLTLHIASRSGRSSFGRLHVLNWALRSQEGRSALRGLLESELLPGTVVVRVEPSLNRAVDYAYGEGLIRRINGNRIALTVIGTEEADKILRQEALFAQERVFLAEVGKRVTEKLVTELFRGQL